MRKAPKPSPARPPRLSAQDKRLLPLAPGLRRKIQRVMVRELIDSVPDFRADVRTLVEVCNFPNACGDADCARAQTCARNFECYVVAHRAFGKLLPYMQEAFARNRAAG